MTTFEPLPTDPDKADTPGVRQPAPADEKVKIAPDPTRYGDWEKNGRCIDF